MAPDDVKVHQVTIFCQGGKAKVWPPYVVMKRGERITFSTINTEAKVILPHSDAFQDPSGYIEKAQRDTQGTIRLSSDRAVTFTSETDFDTATEGLVEPLRSQVVGEKGTQTYVYSVFCSAANDYAEALSSPVIIIEPPQKPPP